MSCLLYICCSNFMLADCLKRTYTKINELKSVLNQHWIRTFFNFFAVIDAIWGQR